MRSVSYQNLQIIAWNFIQNALFPKFTPKYIEDFVISVL